MAFSVYEVFRLAWSRTTYYCQYSRRKLTLSVFEPCADPCADFIGVPKANIKLYYEA